MDQGGAFKIAPVHCVGFQPECQRHHDLVGQRLTQAGIYRQDIGFAEISQDIVNRRALFSDKGAETAGEVRIAVKQYAEVPVEEAEIVDLFEDDVEINPVVFDGGDLAA